MPKVTKRALLAITILLLSGSTGFSQDGLAWTAVKKLIRTKFPTVKQISTQDLAEWLSARKREKPVLLDVRKPEEYEVSHLRTAKLANSEKAALEALNDLNKDHPIVVYCSVGYRSSQLGSELQTLGYKNVYNLEGSIFQWANEGRPVYANGVEVKRVHPFDRVWGHLLEGKLWYKPKEDDNAK